MPQVYVVIGEHDKGKSSLIRALTGVGSCVKATGNEEETLRLPSGEIYEVRKTDRWRVAYLDGGVLPTYIQASAPQEVKPRLSARVLIERVNAVGVDRVIVALRDVGHQAYLSAFRAEGWTIVEEPRTLDLLGTANAIASELRVAWQIV